MTQTKPKKEPPRYAGFEQGPIRPPSEAGSLLIRVTRNCPWNHCTFCPVYKGRKFSLRPVDHVLDDIDTAHGFVEKIREIADRNGRVIQADVMELSKGVDGPDQDALYAALNWYAGGMRSIFLQDANSLIIRPKELIRILNHLKSCFPWIERITSYARSRTVSKISDADLLAIREAGLDRVHIGMESGSDEVLKRVRKGSGKAEHIQAGQKIKAAGMELSEYVMPGLGGQALSEIHATETADALNQINADFIRLRTLALPRRAPLAETHRAGDFDKCTDLMMAKEILLFLEHLDGITSTLASDHILNLFQEVEGVFPDDKERMMAPLKRFLDMGRQDQVRYQVGRRIGIFRSLDDLASPQRVRKADRFCNENGVTPDNADRMIDELMKRFV